MNILITASGQEFCTRMGYPTAVDEDVGECFDGLVPDSIGVPEPTESLQEQLERYWKQNAYDPESGLIVAVFAILLLLVLLKKLWSRKDYAVGSIDENKNLSLDEIRQRQQESYAAMLSTLPDSDSSSSEEEEEQNDDVGHKKD